MKELSEMTDEELNRAVAVEIMGWRWINGDRLSMFVSPEFIEHNKEIGVTFKTSTEPESDNWDSHRVPDCCTSIASAFQVVEHLRQQWFAEDPNETNFWKIVDCCENGWRVDIKYGHHDGDIPIAEGIDKSLPRAICLASLAAVRAGKGEVESR